jgi:signal transduction histidine kinase
MERQLNYKDHNLKSLIHILLIIDLLLLLIETFYEFNYLKSTPLFYKSLINITIIFFASLIYFFNKISLKSLLIITYYSIVLNIIISLPLILKTKFDFNSFFLKTEVILIIIGIASGALIHLRHLLIFLCINIFFICFSFYLLGNSYNLYLFIFYGGLSLGTGYGVYKFLSLLFHFQQKIKLQNNIIKEKNYELNKINQSKDELIKIIRHDLKTPFNQLISLTDIILDTKDEKEKEKFQQLTKEAAINGKQIIDDLTYWAQNLDKNSSNKSSFDFFELAENFNKSLSISLNKKNITLINKTSKNTNIYHNKTLIDTILRNLIMNSIKFSNYNSKIIISSSIIDNNLEFSIEDFGIGMNEETIHKILSKNGNIIPSKGTKNEIGDGYGLSFCYKAIKEENGNLRILSKPMKGTKITITLPLLHL